MSSSIASFSRKILSHEAHKSLYRKIYTINIPLCNFVLVISCISVKTLLFLGCYFDYFIDMRDSSCVTTPTQLTVKCWVTNINKPFVISFFNQKPYSLLYVWHIMVMDGVSQKCVHIQKYVAFSSMRGKLLNFFIASACLSSSYNILLCTIVVCGLLAREKKYFIFLGVVVVDGIKLDWERKRLKEKWWNLHFTCHGISENESLLLSYYDDYF